jgi:hypothetical protein
MATANDEVTALRAVTGELRARVEALETAFTVLFASITGALLLGGILLPFLAEDEGSEDDDLPLFLVSAPFQALGYREDDGSADQESTLIGLALLLLLLVVGSALLVLMAVIGSSAGPGTERWAMITGIFLVLGVLGLWVVVGMGLSNDAEVGPGAVLLSIGALAFAFLVLPDRIREWWADR